MTSQGWVVPVGAGVGYVGMAVATARGVGPIDREAFEELNEDDHRRPWLRLPQQAGTPWVLPGLALIAALRGNRRLALAAGLALPVEKGIEVGTKKLSRRPRPAQAEDGARLRDDAPTDGPSYPSGHAAIATCAVTLLAYRVVAPAVLPAAAVALVVAGTRVHQGAHFPGDAVGGVLLGIAVGSGLTRLTSPASAPGSR